MSLMDYEVEGREARLYDCGDDHFLRVELYDGFFSMGWSCVLPIAAVLERLKPFLSDIDGRRGLLFDEEQQEHVELDAAAAVNKLLASEHRWSFARLELPKVTLVWEQADPSEAAAAPTEERYELAGRGEFGVMATVFDEAAFVRMVRQTATPPVSNQAKTLIDQVAYVADDVGRGHLTSAPSRSDEVT